jgi:hypothetical protein
MPFTRSLTISLQSTLFDEIDSWASANGFDRNTAACKLLAVGLGKAVQLKPRKPKATKRIKPASWVTRAADAAEERSRQMRDREEPR